MPINITLVLMYVIRCSGWTISNSPENGKLGSAQNANSPVCIKQKAEHTEVEIDNASVELCFSSVQYDETSAINPQP